jgi:cell fate regulator YaaT (PSP1 superfamily)
MENQETTQDISDSQKESKEKKQNYSNKGEVTEDNCRFTEGQVLRFVRVRFPGHARSYPFLIGKRQIMYGQKVVAMSDRGMAVGYINSFVYELPFEKEMLPLRSISKIATDEDIEKEKENYRKQKETETICQGLIEKHELDMNLTHVEFTQYGKKAVFYFTAPARVDFRGLVRDLVSDLKLRIELRQISVRDRAASLGSIGPCGRELCCSSFLSKYGNVSIKMAKNQNLTLNYSKLNGVCGQLKCCLQYEDEVYDKKRKNLPREGRIIKTTTGEIGQVKRLHILSEQFDILTTKGVFRRYVADYFEKELKDYEFPRKFENISDETNTVIGLSESENIKARQFNKDVEKLKLKAKLYAQDIYTDLSGIEIEEQNQVYTQAEIKEKQQELNTPKEEKLYDYSKGIQSTEEKTIELQASDKENLNRKTASKRKNNRRPNHKRRNRKSNKPKQS